jgi:hypothetical protein
MRLKLLLRPALLGCLALLFSWSSGHSQFRGRPPRHRDTPDMPPPNPAAARRLEVARQLARVRANAHTGRPPRRPDRAGIPRQARPAAPKVPSPLAPLIAARANANRRKPGASRADGWPANVPAWFREYDTDGDGQIGLYEWKAHGHSLEDFKKADLNGDGFITLKELMRAGFFAPGQEPVPQTAAPLSNQVGKFYYFEITGTTDGFVWGTDVYTVDSPIATAAVHAGVLRDGEKGFVKVTILRGRPSYEGSTRYDVTTQPYGPFHASYTVERP